MNIFVRWYLCLFFLVISCSCAGVSGQTQAILDFSNRFSRQIRTEDGYNRSGFGAAAPTKINHIDFSFETGLEADVAEARRLIIPIIDKMVNAINQEDGLKQYLNDSPVTYRNIRITLGFNEQCDNCSSSSDLDCVMLGPQERLFYYKNSNKGRLNKVHEESIEEAKRILDAE